MSILTDVKNLYWYLAFSAESPGMQLYQQGIFINFFQEARTKLLVDGINGTIYLVGQIIDVHVQSLFSNAKLHTGH